MRHADHGKPRPMSASAAMRCSGRHRSTSPTGRRAAASAAHQQHISERPAAQWSVKDVVAWLDKLHMSHHADKFANNLVDGPLLLELDAETLGTDLKVASTADCKKIADAIEQLGCPVQKQSGMKWASCLLLLLVSLSAGRLNSSNSLYACGVPAAMNSIAATGTRKCCHQHSLLCRGFAPQAPPQRQACSPLDFQQAAGHPCAP